ncbi:D-Ala-D-Ala carboxypeptidase family metallohydrolase [Breoghania sp.]|uniref:YcbK family protein n=1 Tax=Breoghania sp. TaxID=2065378 RepID=UPI0029CA0520|nr:D-Ala-D-Ala carboxypeptidase family metallohydrolase [Breoghania sp.]
MAYPNRNSERSPRRLRAVALALVLAASVAGCSSIPGFGWLDRSNVTWNDTKWCVPRSLKRVVVRVSERFGHVTVTSTKRWWLENWWKGGAPHSKHRSCEAVDFNVRGNPRKVIAFLKAQREVGGYKYYPGGHYHIDNGRRRTW